MDVLQRIDELRGLVNLSDYALCKRCQIPYSTLKAARSRAKSGGTRLSVDTIERVCDTFGLKLGDFFSEAPLAVDLPDPNQLSLTPDNTNHNPS